MYPFDQGSDEENSVEEDGGDIKKFIVHSTLVTLKMIVYPSIF